MKSLLNAYKNIGLSYQQSMAKKSPFMFPLCKPVIDQTPGRL
jgi:hypothetical protein